MLLTYFKRMLLALAWMPFADCRRNHPVKGSFEEECWLRSPNFLYRGEGELFGGIVFD